MRYLIILLTLLLSQSLFSQFEIVQIDVTEVKEASISVSIKIANVTDTLAYFKHRLTPADGFEDAITFAYCVCALCYAPGYIDCDNTQVLDYVNPADTCWSSLTVYRDEDFNVDDFSFTLELLSVPDCGSLITSSEISMSELTSSIDTDFTDVSLFPNPTDGVLFIGEGDATIESISFLRLDGSVVYSKKRPSNSVDISHLNDGIYIVQILRGDDRKQFKRVVKSSY